MNSKKKNYKMSKKEISNSLKILTKKEKNSKN